MKGIILAGGSGSRLYPATNAVCKQLLPVYDKPLIYYPLSTLLMAGLRDILIITTPHEKALFEKLLGDGSQWGINLEYIAQPSPDGLAQAFILGEEFLGDDSACLILGDNILYGSGLSPILQKAVKDVEENHGSTIFSYYVRDPERYGVVTFDEKGRPTDLVEKPEHPQSNYAVIGLYFYDNHVINMAKSLKPSARGELEITDINKIYLEQQALRVERIGRGLAWLDTGTPHSLLDAANFIHVLEQRQLLKIGCPEEIAWRMGYIDSQQLAELAKPLMKNTYGQYLMNLIAHEPKPKSFKRETTGDAIAV